MAKEPRIVKRTDQGGWRVIYYDTSGTRRWQSCKTEDDAKRFIASLGRDDGKRSAAENKFQDEEVKTRSNRRGGRSPLPTKAIDVREAAKMFLEAKEPRVTRMTLDSYAEKCARLVRHLPKGVLPDKVTARDADAYLVRIVKDGNRPTTANTHRVHLKAFWSWMVENELASSNPWKKVKPFKVDPEPPSLVPPSRVKEYLAACTPTFRLIASLAVYAGLRRNEVAELTWFDVDLKSGWILVRKSKSHKPRRVPIHPDLKVALENQPKKAGLVAPGRGGQRRHYRDTSFNKAAKEAAKKIGLTNVTFHGLRATCATLLAAAGVGETAIRDLLGHHDTEVTKVYLGLGDNELQAAINKIKVS